MGKRLRPTCDQNLISLEHAGNMLLKMAKTRDVKIKGIVMGD